MIAPFGNDGACANSPCGSAAVAAPSPKTLNAWRRVKRCERKSDMMALLLYGRILGSDGFPFAALVSKDVGPAFAGVELLTLLVSSRSRPNTGDDRGRPID